MLAGGGVGPFAGCSFAVQRPEQADIEAASRRVRDIADNPVAALAVTIGEIMTAHSLGAARETVSELSGLGGHDAFLVTGAKLVAAPLVMAGLVPAIPIIGHLCHPDRDRRDKPGDDATSFAPVTGFSANPLIRSSGFSTSDDGSLAGCSTRTIPCPHIGFDSGGTVYPGRLYYIRRASILYSLE